MHETHPGILRRCKYPVIASSGVGDPANFSDVFNETNASAALAVGIFHRKEVLSERLTGNNIKQSKEEYQLALNGLVLVHHRWALEICRLCHEKHF
ncbi:glutamine amidotransferase/ cyclase [Vigna unguiculata]|uniref:Glutamine amidotransferase/ cyclase n=1 Tax=Vigna unguiculata TaxID=3917 RepID=A0A4D6N311_VIGUN|nr:glutamine amidotransferase/ cyclase [Vigna unguiculata]